MTQFYGLGSTRTAGTRAVFRPPLGSSLRSQILAGIHAVTKTQVKIQIRNNQLQWLAFWEKLTSLRLDRSSTLAVSRSHGKSVPLLCVVKDGRFEPR